MMENASLLSAIIAASGGAVTAVVSVMLSGAIARAKRRRDLEVETASKRLEGGWSGLVDDWREWSAFVERELKQCRDREMDLKMQYQKCQDEIQQLKNSRSV